MMQLAKMIGEVAAGESQKPEDGATTDAAAVKRGKARAAKLPAEKRSAIAKKAAKSRWKQKP